MQGVFTLWKLANTLNQNFVYCFAICLDLKGPEENNSADQT